MQEITVAEALAAWEQASKRCVRYILHKEVNNMQEITVAEALAAWEQAGQTVEINDGRCQWSREE